MPEHEWKVGDAVWFPLQNPAPNGDTHRNDGVFVGHSGLGKIVMQWRGSVYYMEPRDCTYVSPIQLAEERVAALEAEHTELERKHDAAYAAAAKARDALNDHSCVLHRAKCALRDTKEAQDA